jgi:ubiquinone/menaquinone biosynthesis C-methylase UbiE
MERAYLDYYGQNNIIPVRQDTSNLDLHMARRRSLYRHLGLHPSMFRNRSVLEFGPGTGDNALYIASCSPESYVLVDGNPASIRAIEDKLAKGTLPADRVVCRQSDIRAFESDAKFDVVLCEGVVGGQRDTESFLAHVASFVAPEGALVITTMSPTSLLAEACRRVLKPVIAASVPEDRLLAELVEFFRPDLLSLPGMSRLHEDWVHDNILCPWPERFAFTIPEAIATLDRAFDVLGTSPAFLQDWRWYKSIPQHEHSWNAVALAEYERWAGYFLDYRSSPGGGSMPSGAALDEACNIALRLQHQIWRGALDLVPDFVASLQSIRKTIADAMPETARSMGDFLSGLQQLETGNRQAEFGGFRPWFGRGQQYVSFVRK